MNLTAAFIEALRPNLRYASFEQHADAAGFTSFRKYQEIAADLLDQGRIEMCPDGRSYRLPQPIRGDLESPLVMADTHVFITIGGKPQALRKDDPGAMQFYNEFMAIPQDQREAWLKERQDHRKMAMAQLEKKLGRLA